MAGLAFGRAPGLVAFVVARGVCGGLQLAALCERRGSKLAWVGTFGLLADAMHCEAPPGLPIRSRPRANMTAPHPQPPSEKHQRCNAKRFQASG